LGRIGEPFIRKVSGSDIWQQRYKISKESGIPIFQGSVVGLDTNQIDFLHYLEFYSRLLELDESPPKEIMNNRFLCDEWVKEYVGKKKIEKLRANKSTGSTKKESMSVDF
jgi:hypothetical protein